ncbi:MAG: MmcQ/YjbR family DNA-binding protein [Myxococcales bacterium]|nr:MAG: MmcQ/YjbR family DNA-binding protein [Myxococcales bacterium]
MKTSRKGGRASKAPANAATAPTKVSAKAKAKRAPAAKAASSGAKSALAKISALCLALPETKLTMTWGSPHFRVGEKIFCGFGEEDGKQTLGVKLRMGHAQALVQEPRFWPSKYVGKHGWVTMDVKQRKSWAEVAALIRESYELVAPRASRAKLR